MPAKPTLPTLTTTTTDQLLEIGRQLGLKKLSVHSVDQLPRKLTAGCRIINADNSAGRGTHWVALYYGGNQPYSIYFDPFGVDPDPRTLTYMKSAPKQAVGLSTQSQDIAASSCGYWCLYFLHEMSRGVSPAEFLSKLDGVDQDVNEAMLQHFFSQYN